MLSRAVTWPLAPGLLVAADLPLGVRDASAGPLVSAGDVPFLVATVACWLVGVVLTGRAVRQPAGWAFLGLGTALAWSGWCDTNAERALTSPSDLPAGALWATLGDSSYVWWFVFLALALQFTPADQRARTRWRRRLPAVTIAAGIGYQVGALLRSTALGPPYDHLHSPWAVDSLSGPVAVVASVSIIVTGLCLIASAVGLVRAWRRAQGELRQQLLWLVAGALPLAPCVVASFAASYMGHDDAAGYLMSAAIVALAAGAALSVLRYRLYDVERVVTDSAAYALASASVIVIFIAVVVVISKTTPIDPGSQLPTILATLAGAGAARISYVWTRRAVGRRVNRREFDAVEIVRTGLAEVAPDLDQLLVHALHDPTSRVLYPTEGGAWVTSDGRAVLPALGAVDVSRHGQLTARIEFDGRLTDRRVVDSVAREAAAEIDNVALRAQLAQQLELISESRSRLARAQLEERGRIERDLHDGAQQRLLAIALQLQAAQVNGRPDVLRAEIDRAVADLGLTVQELRDLAAGLHPAALTGGGLLAAVVDLAGRIPLTITYDVVDARLPSGVEGAAWFVISEAVANAVKHAGVDEVAIAVRAEPAGVRVTVADCGVGGAQPQGRGLQGLADRVAALAGTLQVRENRPHGTIVEATLPCVS